MKPPTYHYGAIYTKPMRLFTVAITENNYDILFSDDIGIHNFKNI